jgi:hypothetical protein
LYLGWGLAKKCKHSIGEQAAIIFWNADIFKTVKWEDNIIVGLKKTGFNVLLTHFSQTSDIGQVSST